jgi:hypothetical protein
MRTGRKERTYNTVGLLISQPGTPASRNWLLAGEGASIAASSTAPGLAIRANASLATVVVEWRVSFAL